MLDDILRLSESSYVTGGLHKDQGHPRHKRYQGHPRKDDEDPERCKMRTKARFIAYIKYDINSIRESESAGRPATQPSIAKRLLSFSIYFHWSIPYLLIT